jgi:hypothetical protein
VQFLVQFAPGTGLGKQLALLLKGRASRSKLVANLQGGDIVVAKARVAASCRLARCRATCV